MRAAGGGADTAEINMNYRELDSGASIRVSRRRGDHSECQAECLTDHSGRVMACCFFQIHSFWEQSMIPTASSERRQPRDEDRVKSRQFTLVYGCLIAPVILPLFAISRGARRLLTAKHTFCKANQHKRVGAACGIFWESKKLLAMVTQNCHSSWLMLFTMFFGLFVGFFSMRFALSKTGHGTELGGGGGADSSLRRNVEGTEFRGGDAVVCAERVCVSSLTPRKIVRLKPDLHWRCTVPLILIDKGASSNVQNEIRVCWAGEGSRAASHRGCGPLPPFTPVYGC